MKKEIYIKMLTRGGFNSKGDVVRVEQIDDAGNVYYTDAVNRYCYLRADEEGKLWNYCEEDGEI